MKLNKTFNTLRIPKEFIEIKINLDVYLRPINPCCGTTNKRENKIHVNFYLSSTIGMVRANIINFWFRFSYNF